MHRWKYTEIVRADEAKKEWELFKADVIKAFGGLPSKLMITKAGGARDEITVDNTAELFVVDRSKFWLQFNGGMDKCGGTFVMFGCSTVGTFEKCDTCAYQYDLFVRICLILAYHHGLIRSDISPDAGDRQSWSDAREIVCGVFGLSKLKRRTQ